MPLCSLLSESTASVCGLKALLSVRFSLRLGEMGSALGEAPFPQLQWHSTCAFRWCCLQMKPLFPKGLGRFCSICCSSTPARTMMGALSAFSLILSLRAWWLQQKPTKRYEPPCDCDSQEHHPFMLAHPWPPAVHQNF